MSDDIEDDYTPPAGTPPPPVTNIKVMVRSAYDLQKLRVQMGNRIVANFKAKLGQTPSKTEEETLGEDEQRVLDDLRAEYKKLTDGVKTFPQQAKFKGTPVISSYTELCLIGQYLALEMQEATAFRRLGSILREYPIFTEFLDNVKGIGPAMAGVIISEIDIHKAKYPSSLWAYAGLDVAPNGAGRSRRTEHLVVRDYTDKDGKPAQRNGITFNPFLKTKLVGVLATSFLRCGDNPYRQIYLDYKNRLENHEVYGIRAEGSKAGTRSGDAPKSKVTAGIKLGPAAAAALAGGKPEETAEAAEISKGRRHNMALRKMIKQFLVDLYKVWRALEGLPVHPPYHEAKLGMFHGKESG